MREFSVTLAIFLLMLFIAGCEANSSETSSVKAPNTEIPPPVQDDIDDFGAVQPVALYDYITLGEDESINILDIEDNHILFAINDMTPLLDDELTTSQTTSIVVYDIANRQIITSEDLEAEAVYVYHGQLIGMDFVYSAADADQNFTGKNGYVRRCGEFSWEYPLADVVGDGEMVPMPYVFPSGSVAFIDVSGLFYESSDDTKVPETLSKRMQILLITPDGSENIIFSPEADRFMAYTQLLPYGDRCMFRLETDNGFEIYSLDENGADLLFTIGECRAIYPWWVEVDGAFLLLVGYGDDEAGITSISNVLTTENETKVLGDEYARLTADQNGNILAVDMSWNRFVLRIEGEELEATQIDLPELPGEFYYDKSCDKMYVHLSNAQVGDVGLYEIILH